MIGFAAQFTPIRGVYGDEDQSLALANHLKAKGFEGVVVPMPKQFIEID
ncbi:MAG TPA: hypothetical protein VFW62_02310 [bacterium]|nr:hypothetical protein [bacterium]